MPEVQKIDGGTFSEAGHIYTGDDGLRVLSVTQIFDLLAMTNYEGASEEVLEWKSSLGVAVHKAIELMGENALDWDTLADEAFPFVMSYEDWARAMKVEVVSQEKQGILTHFGMRIGYRYDAIIRLMYGGRMRWAVLELKTTVKSSPLWAIQTAAYALAAPKLPDGEQYLRVALQLRNGDPAIPIYYDDPSDTKTFAHFAFCAIWKVNNKLK